MLFFVLQKILPQKIFGVQEKKFERTVQILPPYGGSFAMFWCLIYRAQYKSLLHFLGRVCVEVS